MIADDKIGAVEKSTPTASAATSTPAGQGPSPAQPAVPPPKAEVAVPVPRKPLLQLSQLSVGGRAWLLAITLGSLMIGGALFFTWLRYPGPLPFALQAQGDAFSFRLLETSVIGPFAAKSLDIDEIGKVEPNGNQGFTLAAPAGAALRMNALAPDDALSIQSLEVPEGWRIAVETQGGGIRLTLAPEIGAASRASFATLIVNTREAANASIATEGVTADTSVPDHSSFRLTLSRAVLDLRLDSSTHILFDRLRVAELDLTREIPDQSGARALPGMREGQLRIGNDSESPIDISRIDRVRIANADAELGPVSYAGSNFDLGAAGTTKRVSNSVGREAMVLTPTTLHVLMHNGLVQILAAIISFVGAIVAIWAQVKSVK